MSKPNIIKIVLAVLFALAVMLGLAQRKFSPDLQTKSLTREQANPEKSLNDYFQEAQQLKSQTAQSTSTSVTFLATGDIMLSRNVATAIQKSGDNDYPFRAVADTLTTSDFNFGNLESPVAPDSIPCHLQPDCASFKPKNTGIIGGHSLIFAAPFAYLKGLEDFHFKMLNLANNHAFDQGYPGITSTKLALANSDEFNLAEKFTIKSVGTGANLSEAWEPAIIGAKGINLCFIGASFSSVNDGGKTTNNFVARIEDTDHLRSAITKAKTECDFVVVTMHAGIEYTRTPNTSQTAFAHAAIDAGADIVIGAHPHWVQTIEQYAGKYIFYSLGNFIFDQDFSQDTKEGLMLKVTVSKNTSAAALQGSRTHAQLDSIQLLPIIIENAQPRLASDAETKKILNKIGEQETILQ